MNIKRDIYKLNHFTKTSIPLIILFIEFVNELCLNVLNNLIKRIYLSN